jgi:lipid A oxidase
MRGSRCDGCCRRALGAAIMGSLPVARSDGPTSFVRIAFAAGVVILTSSTPARADWLFSAYLGTSHTASNTITIEPETGGALRVGPVSYDTRPFTSPVYFGGRVTYFFPARPWLGIGGEWTHNKAIADTRQLVSVNGEAGVPLSQVMTRLEMTNGLNFALANLVVRRPLGVGGGDRLAVTGYAGIGAAVPHVETAFAGATRFEYQLTGLGWQAGGGVEWRLVRGLVAIADLRVSSGRQRFEMGTGDLKATFTSTQVDFGVGWRLGRSGAARTP